MTFSATRTVRRRLWLTSLSMLAFLLFAGAAAAADGVLLLVVTPWIVADAPEHQHAIVRGGRRPNARNCGEPQERQAAQADGQDGTPGTPLTKGTAAD